MRAIVYTKYGAPDVLELREVERPAPGDDQVLIKIRAAAVTPTDCAFRRGDPLIRLFFGPLEPRKKILGTEFSGEIEAVGRDVARFGVGDQIFAATGTGFGAYAEYVVLPEEGAIAIRPSNVTPGEAAAVCDGAMTALPFLRDKGGIRTGHRVLVNGASGSVGAYGVQLARYFGAEVTGVCSTANVELVRSLGAKEVIDYTKEDFTAAGRTYDIIFDAVGKSSFSRARGSLTHGGVYLSTVPTPAMFLRMLWNLKPGGKKAKLAATGMRPAREKTRDLAFLRELVEAGEIKPVLDRQYPMERAAEAHVYVETGHKRGGVVMTMERDVG
ncbi:zinc-binding dehydrogenase [Rubrobacter tropicus]|uniref:Zinc-binding dehydrogenase n=1 Tax=Rubrobacter tropicus TaxID=2653851 RepID=A0A6G8Q8Z4_9ACTN|nr:NAD(P)-dependent alcohol dehydrogenase [Rubrobacter tropicus]QIN82946.1 zinc-binding dehydrogenase [Rubrobacter tropicus]